VSASPNLSSRRPAATAAAALSHASDALLTDGEESLDDAISARTDQSIRDREISLVMFLP